MKYNTAFFAAVFLMLFVITFAFTTPEEKPPEPSPIAQATDSETHFNTMMAVITHKRCMNCHPAGNRPRQGEDSHLHYFNVQRGADGHGVAALKCAACHQKENNLNSGVPGAPHWHLAPLSMAWEGLDKYEIARSFMNPENNGGKTPAEIEKHLTEDDLVLWAFEPGIDHAGIPREKPPVSETEFITAVKAWIAAGAVVPDK